jgi:integrase
MSLHNRSGVYHFDFTINGRRVRGSTHQRNEYQASLVLNYEMTKAREQGVDAVTCKPPILKAFSVDFLDWVENSQKLAPKSRKYYEGGWRLLSTTKMAGMRMDEITNHHCDTTKFPGSSYNANMALRTLRRMFGKAKELKRIFGDLPKIGLRQEWGRSVSMTVADAYAIAGQMPEGDPQDALMILRGTGMRPDEAFSLRWEFVWWEGMFYQNPNGKTKAARRAIPLLGEALPVLRRRHVARGKPKEGWVFPAKSESGHMTTIAEAFNKARDKAGLPQTMVPYTARHGVMTDLSKACTLREVMEIGGHTDIKTAMRYQHPDVAGIQKRLAEAQTSGRIQ